MVAMQRVGTGAGVTWTVVGDDHLPVGPVEEFLEFMRVAREASPHTVRSYATALAGLWSYVGRAGLSWDKLSLPELTGYLRVLRTGEESGIRRLEAAGGGQCRTDRTVATRWAAVSSFYRYHADVHQVPVGEKLYRSGPRSRRSRYVPALVHTHRGQRQVPVVRVRQGDGRPVPLLTPAQVAAILDDCARFDPTSGSWVGSVRDRLLFATLAETGLRLGECLSLRHRDWHLGQGSTPFVEVVPTGDHPHQMRAKGGRFRRVYVSDDLERLYGEYLWSLVDAGAADELEDLEGHWAFVNLSRGERFSPLRSESVYSKVRAIKAHLGPAVPAEWSPHWFRHSHASALLLNGTPAHVVMRRLGHADVQTTLGLYGWVTEDAELRALAGWQSLCPKGASAGE